jgi:hypothetical protein
LEPVGRREPTLTVAALAALLLAAGVGCTFDTSALGGPGDGGPPATDAPAAEAGRDAVGDGPANADHVVVDGDGPRTDGPPPEDGPPCTTGEYRCHYAGEDLEICADGAWTTYQNCALGCNAAARRCATFDARNVPAGTLGQGTCDWTIESDLEVSTDSASGFPCGTDHGTTTQSSCREIMYFTVRSLWIKPGVTLTFTGSRIPAILATGTALVEGTIDVSATGSAPGPGGYGGGGLGQAGSAPAGHTAPCGNDYDYGDSGGAGGCHGGPGGNGGEGGDADPPGQCTAYGSGLGTPICGGGGGGGGRPACGGGGGHGGGAVQLSAGTAITVAGTLVAAGGGGGGGCGSGGYTSGGGGGAGGGLLLEAPLVVVSGTLAANGGGGGGGGYYAEGSGSGGEAGRADRQPAGGGAGGRSGDADYGRGGAGGAGSAAATSGGNASDEYQNGGGGGGASGRVTVWVRAGTWVAGGTISPDPQVQSITPQ